MLACSLGPLAGAGAAAGEAAAGSRFAVVYEAVFADAYPGGLPQHAVSRAAFGPAGDVPENRLRAAARRTLRSRADLLDFPQGRKLLQPNGICFRGEWRMAPDSPYTGLLGPGTRLPALARVSVSLGETRRDARRSAGMGIKIFPSRDPQARVRTRNLLMLDSIAGRRRPHLLDAVMDNEPPLGGLPSLGKLALALRIRADLLAADRAAGAAQPDYGYRPVDHLADPLAGGDRRKVAPRWLRLRAEASAPRVDAADFREELRLAHYPGGRLTWQVEAADPTGGGKSDARWRRIGRFVATESVVSPGCDGRLHFPHPRLPAGP